MVKSRLRTIELFAGVGGFRIGLKAADENAFEVVWSNQFEPSTKRQHASEVYVKSFGPENHSNQDINEVLKEDFEQIPDHDLLVGGFPCQDYSVAKARNYSNGIEGKKGVLWWAIHAILSRKGTRKPSYLMLENVDRLLTSPAKARGRDFAILMSSLSQLGYIVEWRIVNAADYGMPQKRKRVFICGYHTSSIIGQKVTENNHEEWLTKNGVMQNAFPTNREVEQISRFDLLQTPLELSEQGPLNQKNKSPFHNAGIMIGKMITTARLKPVEMQTYETLRDVVLDYSLISNDLFIEPSEMEKWNFLKGAKKVPKISKSGHQYMYAEGPIAFPDSLDKPSRTIITGEGGKSPSRHKHVIESPNGSLRRLSPVELERLNGFPDNHTAGLTDTKRAFLMGNALVVGVVEKLAKSLLNTHSS
jgi:DNA (cytosine-5)-methyltransferase 1